MAKGTGGVHSRAPARERRKVKLRGIERDGGITVTRRIVEPVRPGKQRPSKMKTPSLPPNETLLSTNRYTSNFSLPVPANLRVHNPPDDAQDETFRILYRVRQ